MLPMATERTPPRAAATLPTELPTRLVVTIDTEGDKSRSGHAARPPVFRGVTEGIDQWLRPLFEDFGIRPTYLLSSAVLADEAALQVLARQPDAELGTHLHGERADAAPGAQEIAATAGADSAADAASPGAIRLRAMTARFAQVFGRAPQAFRAGRFGIGDHGGRLLQALGYGVDSSVSPQLAGAMRRATDNQHLSAGDLSYPYTIAGDGSLLQSGSTDLLELPVTGVSDPDSGQPLWLRPWFSDGDRLCRIVDLIRAEPARDGVHRPLVMRFHNMELIPGNAPYPESMIEVDLYLHWLRQLFVLTRSLGIQSVTMSEYRAQWLRHRAARVGACS